MNKMKIKLLTILTFLFSISCNQDQNSASEKQKRDKTDHKVRVEKRKSNRLTDQNKNKRTEKTTDQTLEIKFDQFSISIKDQSTHNHKPRLIDPKQDTVLLSVVAFGRFNHLQFTITPPSDYETIEIEQKFENALTATYGEQQYEHWKDWWEIDKDWRIISIDSNLTFKLLKYDYKPRESSLSKDFEKIKSKVLKYKGDFVTEETKTVTQLNRLPIEIWASKYILKITITLTNKKVIEKFIVFEEMYGC